MRQALAILAMTSLAAGLVVAIAYAVLLPALTTLTGAVQP